MLTTEEVLNKSFYANFVWSPLGWLTPPHRALRGAPRLESAWQFDTVEEALKAIPFPYELDEIFELEPDVPNGGKVVKVR